MLRQRILSAAAGIPLIILAVWHGGIALLLLVAVLMLLGILEIVGIFERLNLRPPLWLAMLGSLLLLGSAYLYKDEGFAAAITLVVILFLAVTVLLYPGYTPVDGAAALLATLYIGLFAYLYLMRLFDAGWIWLTFTLAGTWASDTLAYFVGRSLGRHHLAPVLSPGKTVEGAAGGVAGSVLAALVFLYLYPFLPRGPVLLLGVLLGAAAQVGDLVESAFKRQAGVKDAGGLIPGHGGILDRFDSMLFTAPLVYYFVAKFIIS
ncbi:phosphatidate cytidylyltransferase [Desulfotomaculum copahuensis]|uniref:Phosphatidate cytidylyltransferase n=1 Tax=Desulfotomaculum copahuensis TaxID=1838280 RepID=A0A1B7LHX3_9FIRM|nr:phosphatidate cytidylyltransferase [Desulfotomaculum copahuensis]OAT85858.1 phosphatidate cytidylyltransferase [Desulfotomaculum copahuensis]